MSGMALQMKRDLELVRRILLEMEGQWVNRVVLEIEGYPAELVSYHVMLCHEAGLLQAVDLSGYGGLLWRPVRLTWQGHEFLDAARDEAIWRRAKELMGARAGQAPMAVVQPLLVRLVAEAIGL